MNNLYIGVMSGTSLDGVDVTLCEINENSCKLLHSHEFVFPKDLKNEVLRAGNSITFTIEDDFSGIKSFRGTLDGKWILFDWDPKTSTLKHKTDKALLPRGTQKELILRVLDRLGNIAEFKKTVTR